MEEKLLETFVKAFVDEMIKESKNLFKGIFDEGKQFLSIGLKEYLEKQKNKYSKVKTLLHGITPVYLYDFYFPLTLRCNKKNIRTSSIKLIFRESSFITIIGDAGSGKSTLIKHLFLNTIKEKYGIPILVELRYLENYDGDLEKYISDKIFENKISPNDQILKRLLTRGKFVFFLDGYDEISSSIKEKVILSLSRFINNFNNNKYILTSRPYSNIEQLPLFHNYEIRKLNKNDIINFVNKQLKTEKELAEKIIKSIDDSKHDYIHSFLTNPLLLSLYILTFRSNPLIPNKKYIFYRRVVQALFSEHDSKTKLGYVHERKTNLEQEQFEHVLKRFCFINFFDNIYDYDLDFLNHRFNEIKGKLNNVKFKNMDIIDDLKLAIALWVEDNGIYSFAHRSLQEYFAALFIRRLTEKQKIKVYNKLRSKPLRNSMGEIENLLSLCEEMDKISYYKHFYIPVLKNLQTLINTENDVEKMKSILRILADELFCEKVDNNILLSLISLSDEFFPFIIIGNSYFRKLHSLIRTLKIPQKGMKRKINKLRINIDKKSFGSIRISTTDDIDILLQLIDKKKLLQLTNELIAFIETSIKNANNYVNKTIKANDDILEMI